MPTEQEFYRQLYAQMDALTAGETDCIANLANAAALLWQSLPQINWAGFYRVHRAPAGQGQKPGLELILAPFAGKPACLRITPGKGVCGAAMVQNAAQRVEDVHAFPGHIACDSASNSELVIPLCHEGRVVGVLDIDSPVLGRFTPADQEGLAPVAALLARRCGPQLAALEKI